MAHHQKATACKFGTQRTPHSAPDSHACASHNHLCHWWTNLWHGPLAEVEHGPAYASMNSSVSNKPKRQKLSCALGKHCLVQEQRGLGRPNQVPDHSAHFCSIEGCQRAARSAQCLQKHVSTKHVDGMQARQQARSQQQVQQVAAAMPAMRQQGALQLPALPAQQSQHLLPSQQLLLQLRQILQLQRPQREQQQQQLLLHQVLLQLQQLSAVQEPAQREPAQQPMRPLLQQLLLQPTQQLTQAPMQQLLLQPAQHNSAQQPTQRLLQQLSQHLPQQPAQQELMQQLTQQQSAQQPMQQLLQRLLQQQTQQQSAQREPMQQSAQKPLQQKPEQQPMQQLLQRLLQQPMQQLPP